MTMNESRLKPKNSEIELSKEERIAQKYDLTPEEFRDRLEYWVQDSSNSQTDITVKKLNAVPMTQGESEKLEVLENVSSPASIAPPSLDAILSDDEEIERAAGEGMTGVPAPEPESAPMAAEPTPKPTVEGGPEKIAQFTQQLQEQFPEIFERVISVDSWKNGDMTDREAIAQKVIEIAKTQKQLAEKEKKPEYVKTLAERFPGISKKLESAEGWDRLHPDTREAIAKGFTDVLEGHDAAWVAKILEQKYKDIIFEITATSEQLKRPDHILSAEYIKEGDYSGQHFGKGVKTDTNGNIIIPVYFDDNSKIAYLESARTPYLSKLIPEEYTPEWSADRLMKLQMQYPEIYQKLFSAEYWDELNQETKNMVAEAFLLFLEKYPERLPWVRDGYRFSFKLTKEAQESIMRGEPILVDYLERTSTNPDTVFVVLRPADEVIQGGLDYSKRSGYLEHAVNTLGGIRQKEKEQM